MFIGLLLVASCGKDEEVLEPFEQHLCSIVTTVDGRAETLLLDDDTRYPIAPVVGTPSAVVDTLRVLAYFVRQANGQIRLGPTLRVPTLAPAPLGTTFGSDTATMRVASMWRSSHYINARLDVRSHNEVQTLRLALHHIEPHADGTQTAVMHLYRKPTESLKAFTRTLYLSLDLRPLATTLQAGRDSVAVVVRAANAPGPDSVRYTFRY